MPGQPSARSIVPPPLPSRGATTPAPAGSATPTPVASRTPVPPALSAVGIPTLSASSIPVLTPAPAPGVAATYMAPASALDPFAPFALTPGRVA